MTTEPENHRRWRATDRGVYEVWYLTWNHPATGQGFWLRHVLEAPVAGPAHAELWFARFDPVRPERTFGIHRRFPFDARGEEPGVGPHVAPTAPFELAIGGGSLAHDRASGELSGGGHEVRWDLRWEPARTSLHLLPEVMYGGGGRGETTVLSPNPRVWMTGKLVVDGEDLVFERAVLGQTHLWGKKHAYAWAWAHCAELAGARDALLELLGVRLQRRGVTLPPIGLVALDLDGEQHRFNQFRHVVRNRASWGGGRVEFSAWSPAVKLEGELACSPRQMVNAPYLDPDGTEVFCANTEIGDARVTVWKRAGLRWREHRRLEARGRAHFEVGGRTRDPAVTREHVLVE